MKRSASCRIVRFSGLLLALGFLASCTDGTRLEGDACARQGLVCPDGFVCNEVTGSCDCIGLEGACGEGSLCDTFTGQCICATDDCCPESYRFDAETIACVCAGDDCCPDEHVYDAGSNSCTCTREICCPDGFDRDEVAQRCLCQSDASCGDGFVCDQDTGDCRCQNDAACDTGQFCNDFGFCQAQAACTSTFDCPVDQICDPSVGVCAGVACILDADCPISHICENDTCEPGCRNRDDCWLAEACIEGFCRGDVCDRNGQCGIGERCVDGGCIRMEGPYCASCGEFSPCPDDAACVTQLVEGQAEPYCAVECTPDGSIPCPNGYGCGGIFSPCIDLGLFGQACLADATMGCVLVEVHNEPEPILFCGDEATGEPLPTQYGCSPVFGSCAYQPAPGETTRPGEGESCEILCQDGLVCADVGEGYRCYPVCDSTGGCAGGASCEPLSGGAAGACVGS
jgi:hypothetical protein